MENTLSLKKIQKEFSNKKLALFEATEENIKTVQHFVDKNKDEFSYSLIDTIIIVTKI